MTPRDREQAARAAAEKWLLSGTPGYTNTPKWMGHHAPEVLIESLTALLLAEREAAVRECAEALDGIVCGHSVVRRRVRTQCVEAILALLPPPPAPPATQEKP